MLKSFLHYLLSFGLLFLVAFYAHENILATVKKTLDFSLLPIYIFHAVFSFGICSILLALSKLAQFSSQLGFLYLAGFLLKFFTFALVFQDLITSETALSTTDSLSLLVPIVLFLGLEVYFVAKLLRVMDAEQK